MFNIHPTQQYQQVMTTISTTSMPTCSEFNINTFFNNLPIRIIGTPSEPFFYASDLSTVLGLTKTRTTITGKNSIFREKDIVSKEQRKQHNLVTYRLYKGEWRVDNRAILLTERGAYKLILTSQSSIAWDFQDYIFDFIHNERKKFTNPLVVSNQNDIAAMNEINTRLTTELDKYHDTLPLVYVFKKEDW